VFSGVAVLWFHAAGRRRDAMTLAIVAIVPQAVV
jgi:hypothetical protein